MGTERKTKKQSLKRKIVVMAEARRSKSTSVK